MSDNFTSYREFIARLDRLTASLAEHYGQGLKCAPGCTSCCEGGITLFPIEADYITASADTECLQAPAHERSCRFLREGLCRIYQLRPVVCRTQGLPLLYGNGRDAEVSLCDLNTGILDESGEIDSEYLVDMERVNTILAALNISYLRATGELDLRMDTRVSMDSLAPDTP